MRKAFFLILLFLICNNIIAQNNPSAKKIVVFTPIFLDSAFNDNTFKITNYVLPKNILPGLDFYHGVMLAIDSLQADQVNIEVVIIDSKSSKESIATVLAKPMWDSVSLIIASFKERSEIKPMADFALLKKIPLISATLPNDGGITDNPYFILLNPTLQTHTQGLYKFLQKNYSTNNIVYVKRKGNLENMIQNIFTEMSKEPLTPLKYKTVELTDSFNAKQLFVALDSNKNNIVFCGSIQEDFGLRLVNTLQTNKRYSSVAIGMPTWDGIKEFNKPAALDATSKGIEIIYSSPYNFSRTEKIGLALTNKYKETYAARPSDWVFKGYECMYHFTNLLLKYDSTFLKHLSDKNAKIFNDFDIQSIQTKKDVPVINYMENKKLYFIKKQDGIIKNVQ
jgi:ABC-type branched-subunit amino acid transport system substrate-binding protein